MRRPYVSLRLAPPVNHQILTNFHQFCNTIEYYSPCRPFPDEIISRFLPALEKVLYHIDDYPFKFMFIPTFTSPIIPPTAPALIFIFTFTANLHLSPNHHITTTAPWQHRHVPTIQTFRHISLNGKDTFAIETYVLIQLTPPINHKIIVNFHQFAHTIE